MVAANPKSDRCCQRLAWDDLDPAYLNRLVDIARSEDIEGLGLKSPPAQPGDPTSDLLPVETSIDAQIVPRQSIIVCGQNLALALVRRYDPSIRYDILQPDGASAARNEPIARIRGPQRGVLAAERPLLNFLQRLSGIATLTDSYVQALQGSGVRLLDTRKTTPGYRVLEKYAFAQGGGWNHRIGLFDRVMLKDNHLAAFGSDPARAAKAAVARVRRDRPDLLVEMEVDRLEQIPMALESGVDIILLDNFDPKTLQEAVALVAGRAVTEASGGIGLKDLPSLRNVAGLDFASTGAPIHQSRWIDLGLDV